LFDLLSQGFFNHIWGKVEREGVDWLWLYRLLLKCVGLLLGWLLVSEETNWICECGGLFGLVVLLAF
jgi:hypothetical protein